MIIYLASPYTHLDSAIMEQRFEAVVAACAHYINKGKIVYSPIVHNHPIAIRHELPREWSYWLKADLAMLRHASEFHILCLEGYQQSVGVKAELEFAVKAGIDITYVDPTTLLIPTSSET